MTDQNKAKKTLLDDPFLRLEAPCPVAGQEGKKSTLRMQMGKHGPQSLMNPWLVVYTNDPNEKDRDTNYGRIFGKFTFLDFAALWEQFADLIEAPNGTKYFVDCKEHIFAGGRRSETPVVVSRVTLGKGDDGVLSISVTAKNRPAIVFKFLPRAGFHDWRMADGTPVPEGDLSRRYARGYYKTMSKVMQKLLVENYKEPEPRPEGGYGNNNRGGQQGGGNNWQGGNRGGNGGAGGASQGGGSNWGGGDGDGDIPF